MSIVIFYFKTNHRGEVHNPPQPGFYTYEDHEFSEALKMVQNLRDQKMANVVMSSEPSSMVGKMGVDTVADGKTPDGHDYDWIKRRTV
jgi:hypothetical protein